MKLRNLTLMPRLHGLHVLIARPLDVRQDLRVLGLQLAHLVPLGRSLLFHSPAHLISRRSHLAPLLVSPGVLPPGRKGGGQARQALCGALIQHLLLYTGLMRLEVAIIGGSGGGDEVAAVVSPLAEDQEAKRVLPVNRCERKVLGVVLDALVKVAGALKAETPLVVHLSPRGNLATDLADVVIRVSKYLGFHLSQGNRLCLCARDSSVHLQYVGGHKARLVRELRKRANHLGISAAYLVLIGGRKSSARKLVCADGGHG